jgi:uncharacterized protein YlxW (UPF0749 family)
METVKSYDHNSELQKQARFKTLQITSNKEKGIIKVNGGGTIIIIDDTSISSCEVEGNGQLVINTNDGRKIIFKAESKSETIKLLARLNRALAGSNCELRFELPIQRNPLSPSLATTENNQLQKKFILAPAVAISGLILLVLASIIFAGISDTSNNKKNDDATQDDIWSDKSIKEREEYHKNQQKDREEYWKKQQEKENIPQQTAPTPQNKDTEVAAIMVSVSCAGNKGLIPRSQMGSMMKEMFQDKGIDSTEVYGNWDYYWGIAKEMDAVNKTYCLK